MLRWCQKHVASQTSGYMKGLGKWCIWTEILGTGGNTEKVGNGEDWHFHCFQELCVENQNVVPPTISSDLLGDGNKVPASATNTAH